MAAGDLDRTLRASRARVAALDDAHRAQEVKKSAARVATARAHTEKTTMYDRGSESYTQATEGFKLFWHGLCATMTWKLVLASVA